MKITINAQVLKTALESANKGINPKPTIPSLANFLLEGNGSYLTITGSDGNTTIKKTLPCETRGKALLPTNLLELVRTLPEGDVTIETEDATAKISWADGHATIPVFNPEDFPASKNYGGEYLTIKGETFVSAISRVLFHVADNDIQPTLGGVLFNAKGNGTIDIVASDSYTLGLCTIKVEHNNPFSCIIPAGTLKLVIRLMKTENVELASDEDEVFFRIGQTMIQSRKIVGRFPKYETIIPKSFNSTLVADKDRFLESIKRVMTCSDKASGQIRFNLSASDSSIESQDLSMQVSAREVLNEIKFEGVGLAIGFKGRLLAKCIYAFSSEKININFVDFRKPAVVTSDDDASIALIMPMQIQ